MAEDGRVVKRVEEVRWFDIREWYGDSDQDLMYDWIDSAGDESFSLFPTAEAAEKDGRRAL